MHSVGRNSLGWSLVGLVVLACASGSIAGDPSFYLACQQQLYQDLADAEEHYEQCIIRNGPEAHPRCLRTWEWEVSTSENKYWLCQSRCDGGGSTGPELPTVPMLCPEGEICLPW
jgi:hypothetical protein